MNKYDLIPTLDDKPLIDESLIVQYPQERNIIEDTAAEIKMLKNAFKTSMDKEREQKEKNINPNFFFSVYFQNEAQKENFIKQIGAESITKGLYVNGLEFAKLLGIEIEKENIDPPKKFKSFRKND